jgi:hypothetical protein
VQSDPEPEVGVPMGWSSNLNAVFVENVVQANIRVFGWIIFATEAFIFLTLTLGFLSRLGALVAIGMSLQLTVGLAHTPHEWEWSYILMVLLSVALFGLAPALLRAGPSPEATPEGPQGARQPRRTPALGLHLKSGSTGSSGATSS